MPRWFIQFFFPLDVTLCSVNILSQAKNGFLFCSVCFFCFLEPLFFSHKSERIKLSVMLIYILSVFKWIYIAVFKLHFGKQE